MKRRMIGQNRRRSKSQYVPNASKFGQTLSPNDCWDDGERPLLIRSLSRENALVQEKLQAEKPVKEVRKKRRPSRQNPLDKAVQVNTFILGEHQKNAIMQEDFLRRNMSMDFTINPDFNFTTVNGVSMMFDLRGFTKFCGEFEEENMNWIPAVFMQMLLSKLSGIVKKWSGKMVSVTGDGFLAVFPKKRRENYKRAGRLAVMCSIEMIYAVDAFQCKLDGAISSMGVVIDGPKECGIGLQAGANYFFNIKSHDSQEFDMVSDVSNTVNVSQRYENYSKTISRNMQKYMPLIVPIEILELLPTKLKEVFKQKDRFSYGKKEFVKHWITPQGVKKPKLVYAGSFKKIKKFFERNKGLFG